MSAYQFFMVLGLLMSIKGDTSRTPVRPLFQIAGAILIGVGFWQEFVA